MTALPKYLLGIVISLLLAGLLVFVGGVFVSDNNLGWGAAALLGYAVLMGAPLAGALVLTWVWYMVRDRGDVPARVHALMVAPTLLAALIVPIHESVRQGRSDSFHDAHPAIREVHINLGGRTIELDTRDASSASGSYKSSLPPASANERFNRLTRYPSPDTVAGGDFPYEGAHLKADVQHYTYREPDGTPGASLPLRRRPYPALGRLQSVVRHELLTHHYFHYDDHVEVAPAIARFALMTENDVASAHIPGLVSFSLESYTKHAIYRMEVNAQTLDLIEPAAGGKREPYCGPLGQSAALVDLAQPLHVRWQTLDAPKVWHEAQVTVPAFGPGSQTDPGTALTRVRLYVLPDGQMAAERYREIRRGDTLAVRTTGLPPQAKPHDFCGGVFANFNPQTVQLLRD